MKFDEKMDCKESNGTKTKERLKLTKRDSTILKVFDPNRPSTSKEYPEDIYSENWYKEQRRESAHLLSLLARREMGGSRRRIPHHKITKDIYTAMPLSLGGVCSEMINRDHIISWTPDGTRLICYSFHLDAVRVYHYLGVQNSRNMPEHAILPSLFELDFEVKPHVSDGYQIRMDALYFTACGRFVVIATSVTIPEANVNLQEVFQSNEDMPLSNHASFEDLNLLCIDLMKKDIVSDKTFYMDRIPLTSALNMSGNFLMVTSVQHQIIYILQIHPQTGSFCLLKEIGPAVTNEEEVYNQLNYEKMRNVKHSYNTGLKQAIMTFLYKKAKETGKIAEFLRSMEYLTLLRIEKVHLFECYFLMIRMLPRDVPKDERTQSFPCFFVIMDWRDASILDIFDEFDERFLNWVTELAIPLQYPVTSPAWVGASNFFSHANWALTRGIRKGENTHCAESLRRLLNQLPFSVFQPYKISAQSPYLDPNLFQLDPKTANTIVTGKTRAEIDDPRFIVARTGKASFQLSLGHMAALNVRQVTLLFHPQDPLVVGVDRQRADNSVIVFQPSLERRPSEFSSEHLPPLLPLSSSPQNKMRQPVQLPLRELHLALVGMTGSGKSALAVKYITKRFIGDYDSLLEDTYCRADNVSGQSLMVWVMDTVDDANRDEMRWLAWADVYVVVYDVTSQLSLQYAEGLLERIARHEHLLCAREHKVILLGNKSDLERYRQVSEAEGATLAKKHKASFAEVAATGDYRVISQIFHSCFHNILNGTRSPSPRLCSSDSEIVTPRKVSGFSLRSSSRSSQMRSKPAQPKPTPLHKTPSLSKIKTGSKLLKLFHA